MGSLGATVFGFGFGFGWAPAISFTSHDPDAIQSAYVTPLPEVKQESTHRVLEAGGPLGEPT